MNGGFSIRKTASAGEWEDRYVSADAALEALEQRISRH
jgi:hypothetical protein